MAHKRQELFPPLWASRVSYRSHFISSSIVKDIPATPLRQTDSLLEHSPGSAGMALGPHTEHMIVWPSDLTG